MLIVMKNFRSSSYHLKLCIYMYLSMTDCKTRKHFKWCSTRVCLGLVIVNILINKLYDGLMSTCTNGMDETDLGEFISTWMAGS